MSELEKLCMQVGQLALDMAQAASALQAERSKLEANRQRGIAFFQQSRRPEASRALASLEYAQKSMEQATHLLIEATKTSRNWIVATAESAATGPAVSHERPATDKDARLRELALECVGDGLAGYADFTGFDVAVAEDFVAGLRDAQADFPSLMVPHVSTIQTQVEKFRTNLIREYTEVLKHANKGYTDEEFAAEAKKLTEEWIHKHGLHKTKNAFAWSFGVTSGAPMDDLLGDQWNGIGINSYWAENYERFKTKKVEEVSSGHKPVGCDSPRATIDHELGHEIDKLLDACLDPEINALYDKFMRETSHSGVLSDYATESIKEFIAESYSEYRNNPQPRQYAVQVYNRLIDLYEKMVPQKKLVR